MRDIDKLNNLEVRQAFFNALKEGDSAEQQEAFLNYTKVIEQSILENAKAQLGDITSNFQDEQILINRGVLKPLTSEEKQYFNTVIEKGGFKGVEEAFPVTIIESVFDRITKEHPILSKVDTQTVTGLTKILVANDNNALAFWGPITSAIKQVLEGGFKLTNAESAKLSGVLPVPKSYLQLGPVWLSTYVKEVLYVAMASALEIGIVQGKGPGKEEPVGMIMKLDGAIDQVHVEKEKMKLSNLDATSLAGVRAALAKTKNDNGDVEVIVNPYTYWTKIFNKLTFQTDSGVWVNDRLATGENIIKSHAVEEDQLIVGVLNNYMLAVSGQTTITEYKETLALEDMDLYIAKFFGTGIPKSPNAFFVLDVSEVEGVEVPKIDGIDPEA